MASKIDIRTSHNIVVYYELASPTERVLAFVLDLIAMLLLSLAAGLLLSVLPESNALSTIVSVSIWSFYHLIFEVFNGGQSLGKMLIKIKVVNLKGLSPTPGEALLRWIFRLLDVTLSAGCVGGLCIVSSPKNQRIGDLVSGCIVIKQKQEGDVALSRVLSIQDRDHEVKYPQVTLYTEDDMLLIKEVLTRHKKWKNETTRQAIRKLSDKVAGDLKLSLQGKNRKEILEDLVKDYVVLTR